jgi:hypothetical protein
MATWQDIAVQREELERQVAELKQLRPTLLHPSSRADAPAKPLKQRKMDQIIKETADQLAVSCFVLPQLIRSPPSSFVLPQLLGSPPAVWFSRLLCFPLAALFPCIPRAVQSFVASAVHRGCSPPLVPFVPFVLNVSPFHFFHCA